MKIPIFGKTLASVAVVTLTFAACEEDRQEAIEPASDEVTEQGAGGGAAPEGQADEPAELGPVVTTTSYELRAEPAGPYAAGELGQFEVTITGKGEWHVNQDFPTRVSLAEAEGVDWAKLSFDKGDAAEFREERARFEVPFTPKKAGDHRVTADVSFAICTEETCVPQDKKLALRLPVE